MLQCIPWDTCGQPLVFSDAERWRSADGEAVRSSKGLNSTHRLLAAIPRDLVSTVTTMLGRITKRGDDYPIEWA